VVAGVERLGREGMQASSRSPARFASALIARGAAAEVSAPGFLERLQAFAREIDFAVAFEPISGGAGGWCDPKRRRIVVDAGLPANAQVRVLVHELAHALGVGYEQFGRARAEVIVDTVTFVVCRAVGLRVDGESVPYVAGWGEDGALDAVLEFAETIDAVARRLEDVLIDPAEAEEQGAAA
jgi:Putative metallopeptidase family (DUF6782)